MYIQMLYYVPGIETPTYFWIAAMFVTQYFQIM